MRGPPECCQMWDEYSCHMFPTIWNFITLLQDLHFGQADRRYIPLKTDADPSSHKFCSSTRQRGVIKHEYQVYELASPRKCLSSLFNQFCKARRNIFWMREQCVFLVGPRSQRFQYPCPSRYLLLPNDTCPEEFNEKMELKNGEEIRTPMSGKFHRCSLILCLYISYVYTAYCGLGGSVGIATGYGLDGPGSNPGGSRDFPHVQTVPGAHPSSCTIGTGSFPGVK